MVVEWFEDVMGNKHVQSKDVFIAFAVDEVGNIHKAVTALGVPVVL